MTSISKRSAASRKAWRTRKKMKQSRADKIYVWQDRKNPNKINVKMPATLQRQLEVFAKLMERRRLAAEALPNPFLEIGKS